MFAVEWHSMGCFSTDGLWKKQKQLFSLNDYTLCTSICFFKELNWTHTSCISRCHVYFNDFVTCFVVILYHKTFKNTSCEFFSEWRKKEKTKNGNNYWFSLLNWRFMPQVRTYKIQNFLWPGRNAYSLQDNPPFFGLLNSPNWSLMCIIFQSNCTIHYY